MSRTRIVFFGVLAVFLVLIAIGLGAEIVNARVMQQLFVAATIFAAGVVLLDLFGILGHHSDTGDAGVGAAGHHGDVAAHDVGHGDAGHAPAGHHDGQADGHGHDNGQQGHEAQQAHQHGASVAAPVLSALTYLRLFVYFALGFGPVGWVAMASGRSPLASLALAAPFGIGAVFLAQAFFRFQRKDTDSRLKPAELIAQEAVVLVALDDRNMGRVRVKTGMNVEDLYALSADAGRHYEKGAAVRITHVTDECVYVR